MRERTRVGLGGRLGVEDDEDGDEGAGDVPAVSEGFPPSLSADRGRLADLVCCYEFCEGDKGEE